MDRRAFLGALGLLFGSSSAGALASVREAFPQGGLGAAGVPGASDGLQSFEKLDKPEEEWRRILTDEEFRVLREEATEPAGTSPLNGEKRPGTYVCSGCRLPLFSSETKYESGTGWPSFWAPLEGRMETKRDFKLIWPRTEYHCARCGGHQGHVFDDGPPPTGKRWCNNGVALDFVPEGEELPELRS